MVSPLLMLLLLVALTAAAVCVDALQRRSRSNRLAALANQWNMRFTAEDRFQLTARIAAHFPTPGAADVVVRDLVYSQEETGRYRYFFTIEYTLGVLRTKRRRVAVGMLIETSQSNADPFSGVTLAPTDLSIREQYQWLYREQNEAAPALA